MKNLCRGHWPWAGASTHDPSWTQTGGLQFRGRASEGTGLAGWRMRTCLQWPCLHSGLNEEQGTQPLQNRNQEAGGSLNGAPGPLGKYTGESPTPCDFQTPVFVTIMPCASRYIGGRTEPVPNVAHQPHGKARCKPTSSQSTLHTVPPRE